MGLWPLYLLLIIAIFSEHKTSSEKAVNPLDISNVGTVLFDKSSSSSHCWTNEDLILLNSRKTFQNLLPKIELTNIQNDQYVADLLSYFDVCLDKVRKSSTGKTKHLMLRSLTDSMGGYLQSQALPIVKVSYYTGTVDYHSTTKLFALFVEIKDFLSTNGAGWKKSVALEMFINVTPIDVPIIDGFSACDKLIINSPRKAIRPKKAHRRKRSNWKKRKFRSLGENVEGDENLNNQGSSIIFMPYLDNELRPNSIALPFKGHNLWSLHNEESVNILTKYYETSVNCLSSMGNNDIHLKEFNKNFYGWLRQSVYPRLNDEIWYPAFGGVLRIMATLKILVENGSSTKIFETHFETLVTPSEPNTVNDTTDSFGTTTLILIAICSAVLVSLLVCCVLICYRFLFRKHSCECSPCESPQSDVAMLFKNQDYCDENSCPAHARKCVSEKLHEWWKRKFKHKSRSDCNNQIFEKEQCLGTFNYNSKESVGISPSKRTFKRRRKKKKKSVSISPSPTSSRCTYYDNMQYRYSSDVSSTNSDSSYR